MLSIVTMFASSLQESSTNYIQGWYPLVYAVIILFAVIGASRSERGLMSWIIAATIIIIAGVILFGSERFRSTAENEVDSILCIKNYIGVVFYDWIKL